VPPRPRRVVEFALEIFPPPTLRQNPRGLFPQPALLFQHPRKFINGLEIVTRSQVTVNPGEKPVAKAPARGRKSLRLFPRSGVAGGRRAVSIRLRLTTGCGHRRNWRITPAEFCGGHDPARGRTRLTRRLFTDFQFDPRPPPWRRRSRRFWEKRRGVCQDFGPSWHRLPALVGAAGAVCQWLTCAPIPQPASRVAWAPIASQRLVCRLLSRHRLGRF